VFSSRFYRGTYQIGGWPSVTFAFIGFGTLIYDMSKLEILTDIAVGNFAFKIICQMKSTSL